MKRKIYFASGAVFLSAVTLFSVCLDNEKSTMNEFFSANIEALSQSEIIVGNLCMVAPGYACTSLGVVYEDHYKAD